MAKYNSEFERNAFEGFDAEAKKFEQKIMQERQKAVQEALKRGDRSFLRKLGIYDKGAIPTVYPTFKSDLLDPLSVEETIGRGC